MRIFLIRHPPPLVAPGTCYGRLDVDCCDLERVVKTLPPLPSKAVYSSPARRALKLAEALFPQDAIKIDPRINEMDFGDWEGQRWDDIPHQEIDAWAADLNHFAPPGGESFATFKARVLDFAALPENPHEDVVIITHAGVMRVLVGFWQQLPENEWPRLEFAFGGLVQCYAGKTLIY